MSSAGYAPNVSAFHSQDSYPPSTQHLALSAATAYATPPESVQSMDGRPHPDYHAHSDSASLNASSAATAAAAHYQSAGNPDVKYAQSNDYTFQRGGYPDGSQRFPHQTQPATTSAPAAVSHNMAQSQSPSIPSINAPSSLTPNAPSQPTMGQDNAPGTDNVSPTTHNSNNEVPVDPNIAAQSPTYPQQQHYDQHPYHQQMPPQYHQTPPTGYPPRPEHGGYGYPVPPGGLQSPYGHVPTSMSTPPGMVPAGARPGVSPLDEQFQRTQAHLTGHQGGHPLAQVYSFVPIPGTHQQKRPRRRYEEIERMYKCGWNGCEKAYGTLNHLNAHVTMQSHGSKRTPEEFKEIRKEWKARKKEEDSARKAEEERQRQAQQQGGVDGQAPPDAGQPGQGSQYPPQVRQLPPLGYQPATGQVGGQYPQPGSMAESMPQYSNGHMPSYYPQSPYGQGQMYHQQHPTVPGQAEAPSGQ